VIGLLDSGEIVELEMMIEEGFEAERKEMLRLDWSRALRAQTALEYGES
jgi:hypothetical protein